MRLLIELFIVLVAALCFCLAYYNESRIGRIIFGVLGLLFAAIYMSVFMRLF